MSSDDVTVKEAFDIYQKLSDSQHKLWTYFQVVSLAVLAYTVGSEKSQWSIWTYALISSSYVFFAIANQYVIALSQRELCQVAVAVKQATEASGPIGKMLSVEAVKVGRVRLFHTISAVIVLLALWGTWYDKCAGSNKKCPAYAITKSSS